MKKPTVEKNSPVRRFSQATTATQDLPGVIDSILLNKEYSIFATAAQLPNAETVQSKAGIALAAGDLTDPGELRRIRPMIASLTASGIRTLLVAGYNADDFVPSSELRRLRRELEALGAVFVPRPRTANTSAKVAAFLNREYAPAQEAIDAALKPRPRIPVVKGQNKEWYREPLPAGFAGDPIFLAHRDPDGEKD